MSEDWVAGISEPSAPLQGQAQARSAPVVALQGSGVRIAHMAPGPGLEVKGPKGGGRVGARGVAGGAGNPEPRSAARGHTPRPRSGRDEPQQSLHEFRLGADRSHLLVGHGGSVLAPLHPGGGNPIPAFWGR